MTLKTDRRTQHRKRPLSLVYVELPPSNGGMMRDLSEQGFSLRAMMPVSPSEKIPFSFVLDSSARIEGDAIVLRVEDGGRVAAMEFAGLPAHCRDQIRRWLDKFDEPISPASEPAQTAASKHASLAELRAQIRAPKEPSPPEPVKSIPPSVLESSPPPPVETAEVMAPPPSIISRPLEPETTSAPPEAAAEPRLSPPTVVVPAPPMPEPPPVEEIPQPPAPITMALPKVAPPPPQETLPTPSPQAPSSVEQQDVPALPPLLKLSSVRPGPLPAERSVESDSSIEVPKHVEEPPARVPHTPPKPEPPAVRETSVAEPAPMPPVARKRAPALEPLSSLEGETDSDAPGWMDRFTLGRAVGIMLFLTLLAGSYVYHRELGQALIWLGHQIAGDESPENSKSIQPNVPSTVRQTPEPTPATRTTEPQSSVIQRSTETTESASTNLPAATDKTPSPQLKGGNPGSLVPLTQITRPAAPPASADNSVEPGQPEYLQALQILRSPGRSSEVPAAIKLLWVAVEKGNTGAEIDLAELFRTGRGVTKNCDQTRVLLSAAARKGSAEARKRLEAFQRQGCGN